jgi:hypothetical protein
MDCKATVELGDSSRNGRSRTQVKASDHDMGNKAKYIPCGILDEDSGALHGNVLNVLFLIKKSV